MVRRKRYGPTVRRKMIWARSQDLFTAGVTIPAVGVAVDLLAQFRADGGSSLGSTVTRVRIDLSAEWSAGTAPGFSTGDMLALGVIVDQIQADQTEVPRPGVEEHADWMYWRRTGISRPGSGAIPVTGGSTSYVSGLEVDVQSQRKMEELGQTLWLVADPTYDGGTSVQLQANASVLLKLP